ncbi:chaplin [Streptomyces sp. NPDC048514]|uniref:chaplin n=1 Tax=Streptomyces sp. NPDC048514 TaxID=3365564 RepID=UPI0037223258
MKRVTRNSVIAIAAASGAMAVGGAAYADSTAGAAAAGSPGLISGNALQLPVHVPVSVCGNTVNVAGLLNPAMGNKCANEGAGAAKSDQATDSSGATAEAVTKDSPGVVSGNGIQLPVDLPVNISGNTVDVVGVGNPVFGNTSTNTSTDRPAEPVKPTPPPVTPPPRVVPPAQPHTPPKERPEPKPAPRVERPRPVGTLASTGTDGTMTAVAASVASLLGGTVLYRRFRSRVSHGQG